MPAFSTLLTGLAEKLTQLENYETEDGIYMMRCQISLPLACSGQILLLTRYTAHEAAFIQKIFVINVITSYLPIALTAFVYVPFGKLLVPYLNIFQLTAQRFTGDGKPLPTQKFEIDPNRLTQQVIYFTVTAQIVNVAMEIIVPYAKRNVFRAVKDVQIEISSKNGARQEPKDLPEEAAFLSRVRFEAELEEYDVAIDYREMVVQFGR